MTGDSSRICCQSSSKISAIATSTRCPDYTCLFNDNMQPQESTSCMHPLNVNSSFIGATQQVATFMNAFVPVPTGSIDRTSLVPLSKSNQPSAAFSLLFAKSSLQHSNSTTRLYDVLHGSAPFAPLIQLTAGQGAPGPQAASSTCRSPAGYPGGLHRWIPLWRVPEGLTARVGGKIRRTFALRWCKNVRKCFFIWTSKQGYKK